MCTKNQRLELRNLKFNFNKYKWRGNSVINIFIIRFLIFVHCFLTLRYVLLKERRESLFPPQPFRVKETYAMLGKYLILRK